VTEDGENFSLLTGSERHPIRVAQDALAPVKPGAPVIGSSNRKPAA
jgi:hypothetical protein